MGIDPNKLTVLEADAGDVIFADPPEARWDTVFVDIWPHLNDVWEDGWRWQAALPGLLRPGGIGRIWLDSHYAEVRRRSRNMEFSMDLSTEPCFTCGKAPRVAVGDFCLDCADVLGLSRSFNEWFAEARRRLLEVA